jgi:hypothetical protein
MADDVEMSEKAERVDASNEPRAEKKEVHERRNDRAKPSAAKVLPFLLTLLPLYPFLHR